MRVVGIDYSITSPAICLFEGEEWSIENCIFVFSTVKNKWEDLTRKPQFTWFENLDTSHENMERFDNLAKGFIGVIDWFSPDIVGIEDYSMGSKGRVFHIAENAGILKYALWQEGYKLITIPPTVAKKYAFGKGNANKEKMLEAFTEDTGFDIMKEFGVDKLNGNPVSDIVDAYWMCKYSFEKMKEDDNK